MTYLYSAYAGKYNLIHMFVQLKFNIDFFNSFDATYKWPGVVHVFFNKKIAECTTWRTSMTRDTTSAILNCILAIINALIDVHVQYVFPLSS